MFNIDLLNQLEQYRTDFGEERKDREAAAGKFAEREKEWMKQIEELTVERDQLKANSMHFKKCTVNHKHEVCLLFFVP